MFDALYFRFKLNKESVQLVCMMADETYIFKVLKNRFSA